MRVLEFSTLYIELGKRVSFPIAGLKGSGIVSTVPKLSIFRNYVEITNELPGTWLPITWLDIILSCDNLGRGIGVFVVLCVSGVELNEVGVTLLVPLLNGISC